MIKKMMLASLVVLTLAPINGKASWQYTKWGMTQEQVKAASPSGAVALTPKEQQDNSSSESPNIALLKAPYSSGAYQFDAIFSFDRRLNSLASVQLKLINSDRSPDLLGSLRAKYGEPSSEKRSAVLTYAIWYKDGDQINYLSIGGSMTSVTYKPRENADNSGL